MNLTSCETAQCSNITCVCSAAMLRNCGVVRTDLYWFASIFFLYRCNRWHRGWVLINISCQLLAAVRTTSDQETMSWNTGQIFLEATTKFAKDRGINIPIRDVWRNGKIVWNSHWSRVSVINTLWSCCTCWITGLCSPCNFKLTVTSTSVYWTTYQNLHIILIPLSVYAGVQMKHNKMHINQEITLMSLSTWNDQTLQNDTLLAWNNSACDLGKGVCTLSCHSLYPFVTCVMFIFMLLWCHTSFLMGCGVFISKSYNRYSRGYKFRIT